MEQKNCEKFFWAFPPPLRRSRYDKMKIKKQKKNIQHNMNNDQYFNMKRSYYRQADRQQNIK